ncbi:sigma factor-like helix-turn-helix DNA-binding protein [Sphingomonas sp. ERG5]|uniref:sigma factor-like helix-turn-helix DNA-binding protein n=1 Tax=Sphingomonas sp. ERG5 TaxID=1381597 RepID=UPI00054B26F7|nr:sigma factor-like helix-turn-helix DNA-binding protein [Sphingomonas sp. ERG5]
MSENLTEAEIIERLEAGLQRMPKLRREIFLAIRLDDLSYGEIAERTGLSTKQVERQFARSMVTLLEAFDGRPPVPWWRRLLRRFAGKLRR